MKQELIERLTAEVRRARHYATGAFYAVVVAIMVALIVCLLMTSI